MNPPQQADASSGFHDIKPLPEFHPFPIELVGCTAGLLLLSLLIWWYFKNRKREPKIVPAPPLSPLEQAQREFADLEILRVNKRISLRDLGSRYSLAMRLYLERRMNFSAAEQTVAEVCAAFPARVKARLPTFSKDRTQELTAQLKTQLRFFEQLAFSNRSSEIYHLESDEIVVNAKRAFEFIKAMEAHLNKEEERVRSVVESRLPPPDLQGPS